MDIPKMKVLIYALTFLGYAWSGYGSGLLGNLRDAIVAAEHFFGNFLENAIDIAKKLGEMHRVIDASDEDCKYSCPSGVIPTKNKYHKPSYNGCGTDVLKLKISEYIPALDMTECCNLHDLCYDTCNNLKKNCDEEFKKCLHKICHKLSGLDTVIKACKVAATMVSSTMSLGCKSYLESQKQSCYCPQDGKKRKFTYGNEL